MVTQDTMETAAGQVQTTDENVNAAKIMSGGKHFRWYQFGRTGAVVPRRTGTKRTK